MKLTKLLSVVGLSLLCVSNSLQAQRTEVIESNGITLWTETFGDRQNPPLLLIMGSGSQCILWCQDFCEKLADASFFVIRYDHRDTGLSTAIDYAKSSYTIMDLTQDAVGIIDHYKIKKAHILGASMGGVIAQFMGAYFPERVESLNLLVTSTSLEVLYEVFEGRPTDSKLSKPKDSYMNLVKSFTDTRPQTTAMKIERFIAAMRLLNGDQVPFDEEFQLQIAKQNFARKTHNGDLNHLAAMKASFAEHRKAPAMIKAPTYVMHGDQDLIFGPDHGEALEKEISGSKLFVIKGMGHLFNTRFYDEIVGLVKENAGRVS